MLPGIICIRINHGQVTCDFIGGFSIEPCNNKTSLGLEDENTEGPYSSREEVQVFLKWIYLQNAAVDWRACTNTQRVDFNDISAGHEYTFLAGWI